MWLCVSLWELWELGREGAKKYILPWGIVNNEVWGTFCAAPILVSNPKYVQRVEYLSMATEVPWVRGVRGSTLDMIWHDVAHCSPSCGLKTLPRSRIITTLDESSLIIANDHRSPRIIPDCHSSSLITTDNQSSWPFWGCARSHAKAKAQRGRKSRCQGQKSWCPGALVNTENVHPKGLMFDPSTCAMVDSEWCQDPGSVKTPNES